MDCSIIYPNDNGRRCQTIDFGYRRDIAGYLYILDKITYNEDIRNKYYNKLVNRHEENLSFEEHNPPVHYSKQRRTSSRSSTRTATITDMFSGKESTVDVGSGKVIKPKENAATRKAKALKDKSISFAFNNGATYSMQDIFGMLEELRARTHMIKTTVQRVAIKDNYITSDAFPSTLWPVNLLSASQ